LNYYVKGDDMYTIFFESDYDIKYPKITNPKLENVLMLLGLQNESLKTYYFGSNYHVKRPNIFINLLNMFSFSDNDRIEDVLEYIDANAIYYSRQVGFVNIGSRGEVLKGNIIPNTKEIMFYTSFIDLLEINENNYTEFRPIKCIYNTFDYIMLTHPQKFDIALPDLDLCMYVVDTKALALQYYYWFKDMLRNEESTDLGKFLYKMPFTNVMDSILDISLFNRFISLWDESYVPDFINFNPKSVMDLSERLDREYLTLIKKLKAKNKMYVREFLSNIPLTYGSAYERLKIPMLYFNVKTELIVLASRFKHMVFLLTALQDIDRLERDLINDLRIKLRYIERDSVLLEHYGVEDFFKYYLMELKTLIKMHK